MPPPKGWRVSATTEPSDGPRGPYYNGRMMRPNRVSVAIAAVLVVAALAPAPVAAQTRRAPARRTPPKPKTITAAPEVACPATLGVGVSSQQTFCDVLSGRDPAQGILVKLPPHRGAVVLTFDLHNRHTYSEEQVREHRAYARYTATIGVLTMDNTLISRAVVQNEFRTAADIVDRIKSDIGPMGVKAVVPTGTEPVRITIPASEQQVSILGEKLTVDRSDGSATYTSLGRPIAVISNVMVEYTPAPAPAPRRRR